MTSVNDNWTDNLLVKEKTGKIHSLKNQPVSNQSPKQSFLSLSTAPADEHFSHSLGTDFSFHPDDHQELLQIAKNLPRDESKKYSIGKIVDRLIEKQGLHLDDTNKQKFTSLLFDFFRDRKKSFVVREELATQIDPSIVDGIISVIKGIKNKIDTVGGLVVDTVESASPAAPKPAPKMIEPAPTPASPAAPKPAPKMIEPAPAAPKIEVKIAKITPKVLPKVSRPQGAPIAKKQIADVSYEKPAPRSPLMGPIQELQSLTLKHFRYLGDTAQDKIDKIHDKIHVLERQSFTKKAEGIKAWRQSPVYQLYLSLGADSMGRGQDISKTIADYTKEGKPVLTLEEFSAISDLNKTMRF